MVWYCADALSGRDGPGLVGRRALRGYTERGHLAAAACHVGEAGGTEAREEATDFSAEQVRRKIHQHVAVIDFADVRDIWKNFTADRDALLGDPHTVLRRKCALDRHIPIGFAGFPAERHAGTSVFVAGFQDQVLAFLADKS